MRPPLSDAEVVEIREAAIQDGETSYDLAFRFGVDAAYVRRIVRGVCRPNAGGPTRNLRTGTVSPPVRGLGDFDLLDELPDMVIRARERDQPIVYPARFLPSDPEDRRSVVELMAALGVEVVS